MTQPQTSYSPHPSRYTELSGGADPGRGIEAVWVSVADKASAHRVLPDGRCDIILRFCAKVSPINSITVVVTGPTTRHYDVVVKPGMGFAGIRLRPGFFHAILGLSPAAAAAAPVETPPDPRTSPGVLPDEFAQMLARLKLVRSLPLKMQGFGSVSMYWRNDEIFPQTIEQALDCIRDVTRYQETDADA